MPSGKSKRSPRFPVEVIVDTREQMPWSFSGITAHKRDGEGLIEVSCRTGTLKSGDYSLEGFIDRIAIERKSIGDLFGTIGGGRARFERELERLAGMEFAAVVCEADWALIYNNPPRHTELKPKTVFASVIAWQQRYPRIHWWMLPDRRFAEVATFRILERFYRESEREEKAKSKVSI